MLVLKAIDFREWVLNPTHFQDGHDGASVWVKPVPKHRHFLISIGFSRVCTWKLFRGYWLSWPNRRLNRTRGCIISKWLTVYEFCGVTLFHCLHWRWLWSILEWRLEVSSFVIRRHLYGEQGIGASATWLWQAWWRLVALGHSQQRVAYLIRSLFCIISCALPSF